MKSKMANILKRKSPATSTQIPRGHSNSITTSQQIRNHFQALDSQNNNENGSSSDYVDSEDGMLSSNISFFFSR